MKKIFILFLLIFFAKSLPSLAAIDPELCSTSPSCKNYCTLRNQDKYDENNSKHEAFFTHCLDDVSLKQNNTTNEQVLGKLQEALSDHTQQKTLSQNKPKSLGIISQH